MAANINDGEPFMGLRSWMFFLGRPAQADPLSGRGWVAGGAPLGQR